MGDVSMQALWRFAIEEPPRWAKQKRRLGAIANAILATDLASLFTHAGAYTEEKKIGKPAQLRAVLARGTSIDLLDVPDPNKAQTSVYVDLDDDSLQVNLTVGAEAAAARRDSLLETLAQLGRAIFDAMSDLATMDRGWASPRLHPYPSLRPPVVNHIHKPSSVLDFHDRRTDTKLAAARLPAPAKRSVHGDLVIDRWAQDLEDEAALSLAMGAHERWLSRIVPMERAFRWNDHGDQGMGIDDDREKLAPFTFYDRDLETGFQAIVVDARGTPDARVWKKMTKLVASLPEGVKQIMLIAPVREAALALTERARAAGFAAVLYPGDDDDFYDPAPPGWWQEDVSAARSRRPPRSRRPRSPSR